MKTVKDKQLVVGADFAGFPLKEVVVEHLTKKGWTILDLGVKKDSDPSDTDLMFHRVGLRNETVADEKLTLGNLLESCDHTESGRLSASGRSYENYKFLVLDFKVKVRNRGNTAGILLIDMSERQACHFILFLLKCVYGSQNSAIF